MTICLAKKYNLPSIDIFNDNGTLSEAAGLYIGMDRLDVRKQIEQDLQAAGLLEKVEAYTNKVGFSERTNVAIEPKLSMQWFLKMQHFADMALPPVMNDELKFYLPNIRTLTATGWKTSRTGVSAVNCGGDTAFRPTSFRREDS